MEDDVDIEEKNKAPENKDDISVQDDDKECVEVAPQKTSQNGKISTRKGSATPVKKEPSRSRSPTPNKGKESALGKRTAS